MYAAKPFKMFISNNVVAITRDRYLFRAYKATSKFQVDATLGSNPDLDAEVQQLKTNGSKQSSVFGVFGHIKLKNLSYLIIIEDARLVGSLFGNQVMRVEKLMFIPMNPTGNSVDSEDQKYIDMINVIQREKAFYFSYDLDLTKNVQRTLEEVQSGSFSNPQAKDAFPNAVDPVSYFVFNNNLLAKFESVDFAPFKVPCIFGYVYISKPQFKPGQKTDFCLVSRKDCRRPGRRFVTRGLDNNGNAANFVETEHIFVHY